MIISFVREQQLQVGAAVTADIFLFKNVTSSLEGRKINYYNYILISNLKLNFSIDLSMCIHLMRAVFTNIDFV